MICIECGKDKSVNEFYTYKRGGKIFYRSRCKACMLGHEPKELRGLDLNAREKEIVRVTRIKRELDRLRDEPIGIEIEGKNLCKELDKLQKHWEGKIKLTKTQYWETYYTLYGAIYQMQEKKRGKKECQV